MKKTFAILALVAAAGAAAFYYYRYSAGAIIATGTPVVNSQDKAVSLEQGWSVHTQQSYYFTNQGSRILPYDWFLALEMPDSKEYFRGDENMRNLRYLPTAADSKWNPHGLPVGFVRGFDDKNQAWLGMTCAACHTGQIAYNGTTIRIDGGQTIADVDAFDLNLVAAMKKTAEDDEKFGRFATAVLGKNVTDASLATLRDALKKRTAALQARNDANHYQSPSMPQYGYGRTDAIGQIFNKVLVHMNNMPDNALPSDAPVSYPFLWGTHQSDVVQWTGFAPNGPFNIGSLIRNGGEVLGVYGEMDIPDDKNVHKYKSSIVVESIGLLEQWVAQLRSPKWPEKILPPVDRALADKGRIHYEKHCITCHAVVLRENEGRAYQSVLVDIDEVKTDSREYDNMVKLRKAGKFAGRKQAGVAGDVIVEQTNGLDPLINSVVGGLLEHPLESFKANIDIAKGEITAEAVNDAVKSHSPSKPGEETGTFLERIVGDFNTRRENLRTNPVVNHSLPMAPKKYKARPLTGIWATPPYLHNGSVPNLKEILLPAAQRSKTFHLGTREYDPAVGGYKDMAEFDGKPSFTFDTSLPGNSNSGHEYGAELTETQRQELLEFLKTL
ncbi:di-heme-cytochrome C peroxidase [Prosthecobacter sp.]|uniref:di-heme-cytochrome C peroxidase n=1 Tax=Prosthecobacter sp. TaxID=1965333 RepID=UPI0037843243